ncbi:MAG: uroporphyrinogen-III synthase [Pseudomonadota bacterium]
MTQPAPLCLLTRPAPESARLAARLGNAFGLKSVLSPLIDIEPVNAAVDFAGYRGVIVTSSKAAERVAALGAPRGMPVFAVGRKTAAVAARFGFKADAAGGDAEALISHVEALRPEGPLLHLRGDHSRGDVARRLTSAGLPCHEAVIYRQKARQLSKEAGALLAGKNPVILPLFSPRTAAVFEPNVAPNAPLFPVALSAAVAAASAHFAGPDQIVIADTPTEDAMIASIGHLSPVRAWLEQGGMQS